MKKRRIAQFFGLTLAFSLSACIVQASEGEAADATDSEASVVYMTSDISPEGMMGTLTDSWYCPILRVT